MYEDEVKNIGLNCDELSLILSLLEDYSYSSIAERLLVESLIDKLNEE